MVRFHPHPPNKELIMETFTLVLIGGAFAVGYILPRPAWAEAVYNKVKAKFVKE